MFWIPLIGPIIQGISSIFTSWFSSTAQIKQAQVQENIALADTSAQIIKTTNDDILLRILRDLAILPVVVWSALIGWDTIIGAYWKDASGDIHRYHEWATNYMWIVGDYPPAVTYLPYVVMVFLFGNIGLNMWRNKI
jgi:hypothetical protein